MNEEQVLKLAVKFGLQHGDLCDYDLSFEFGTEKLLAFANACCDYQRELDATVAENWSCDMTQECSVAEAIRANKGE